MDGKLNQVGFFIAGCVVASAVWIILTKPYARSNKTHAALDCAFEQCSGNPPLMAVNGHDLGRAELPFDVQASLAEAQGRQFNEVTQILDDAAVRIAVAIERGGKDFKNIPTLSELLGKNEVTDTQVQNYYQQHKSNFPTKMKFQDLAPQIRQILKNSASQEVVAQKRNELRQFAKVKLKVMPPQHAPLHLDLAGLPTQGNASGDGVVTLIEVTNYTCERCTWSKPQLDELLKKQNGKVKLVRIVADLKNSVFANYMARGAYCALQKSTDTFWAFDVRAYAPKPVGLDAAASAEEEKRISRAHVLKLGREAGLADEAELAKCLDSENAEKYAKHNAELAIEAGITSLPAFVVNGQRHAGGVENLERTLNNAHDMM